MADSDILFRGVGRGLGSAVSAALSSVSNDYKIKHNKQQSFIKGGASFNNRSLVLKLLSNELLTLKL